MNRVSEQIVATACRGFQNGQGIDELCHANGLTVPDLVRVVLSHGGFSTRSFESLTDSQTRDARRLLVEHGFGWKKVSWLFGYL